METINFCDINFEKLKVVSVKSTESHVFLDSENMQIYKFFKNSDIYDLCLKSEKLKLLKTKRNLSEIVIPNAKIISPGFCGIRENYIDGIDLINIKNKYNKMFVILEILIEISKSIKKIHDNKIIITDLNANNIRITDDLISYFLDALSYKINGIPSIVCSAIYYEYIKKNKYKLTKTQNMDKISFILICFEILFDKSIFDITSYDFDEMEEKIKCLRDLRPIFNLLKDNQIYIPDIPYLHEVVTVNNEDYVFANKMW